MKIQLRHIVYTATLALLLAAMSLLAVSACGARSAVLCDALDVQLPDESEFVAPEDVKGFLDKRYGAYIGVRLDSLDLDRIETLLESKGVVESCEAWTTPDGVLHVSVRQRKPVLRFQRGATGFYMDRNGEVFPLHKTYTADVPVIEGDIPDVESGAGASWAAGVLRMMDWLQGSKQWKDQVDRISVGKGGDLEMRLKDRSERFILGWPDGIDGKLDMMGKYFSHILPAVGDGCYKSVNLKYNKQIICRKDI